MPVRELGVNDVDQIANVHVTTWQASYRSLFTAVVLDDLNVEKSAAIWKKGFTGDLGGDPPFIQAAYGFEQDGVLQGFCTACEARDEDSDNWGEVSAIYVHPDAQDMGVGSQLIGAAELGLQELGYSEAIVWTAQDMPSSRGFYESNGWHFDGSTSSYTTHDETIVTVRYRKAFTTPLRD